VEEQVTQGIDGCIPRLGAPDQACRFPGAEFADRAVCNEHRLHKPGVAGSSPAAATCSSDEPIDQYHADKAWYSKSQLWDLVSRGPQWFHGRHVAGSINSTFDHPALQKGRLIHEWAEIGPDAWWQRVVTVPEDALGANGRRTKKTEEWEATLPLGAICLKPDEVAAYKAQFASILANPVFHELTEATVRREFSIRWRDVSGLPLKCRPDATTPRLIWDIKTTKEQKPLETFWRSVVDYGYAFQQALYTEGMRAAGLEVEGFVFLVTSTVPPYACHAVRLPERLVSKARKHLRKVIAEVQMRLELDHWLPADSGQVTELFVPERFMEDGYGSGQPLPRVL
jgi:hypothetical protein